MIFLYFYKPLYFDSNFYIEIAILIYQKMTLLDIMFLETITKRIEVMSCLKLYHLLLNF